MKNRAIYRKRPLEYMVALIMLNSMFGIAHAQIVEKEDASISDDGKSNDDTKIKKIALLQDDTPRNQGLLIAAISARTDPNQNSQDQTERSGQE